MHNFSECELSELCDLRMRARDDLARTAQELRAELLDTAHCIHLYITDHACDPAHPDIQRLRLGSWNTTVLTR